MKSQLDKLNDLWWDCVELLTQNNPCIESKHMDAIGYLIPDEFRDLLDIDFTELMHNNYDEWILLNEGGYHFDLTVLSTDTLCQLTDLLIEKQKGK